MTAEELWQKSGLSGEYEAWAFSDAPDKLAALVQEGIKTATCSSYDLYVAENEPIPRLETIVLFSIPRTTQFVLCAHLRLQFVHLRM